MTRRQDIFNKVVAQLRKIKVANTYTMYGDTDNYLTDVGLHVYAWRAAPFPPNTQMALVVRDLDEPAELSAPRSSRQERSLHMQVEIVISGDVAMETLRDVFADVEAAVGEGRESVWDSITSDTRPRITRSVLEQESAKIAGGIFEFFIDYPTLAFKSVM